MVITEATELTFLGTIDQDQMHTHMTIILTPDLVIQMVMDTIQAIIIQLKVIQVLGIRLVIMITVILGRRTTTTITIILTPGKEGVELELLFI